jgi:hypothetical protein
MAATSLPDIALLPPSEFTDLLQLLQQHFTSFNLLSEHSSRDSSITSDLTKQRREIDTHYGWVLASDSTLVGRILVAGDRIGDGNAKGEMKRIWEGYERIGEDLSENVEGQRNTGEK